MPSAIIRGRAISCCFPGVPTSAATDLFNAASGWAASCVIIIRRRRELEGPQMNFLTVRLWILSKDRMQFVQLKRR